MNTFKQSDGSDESAAADRLSGRTTESKHTQVIRPVIASRLDHRFLAPALITCILLVGQLTFGMLESWTQTLMAIGTAIACELALGKLLLGSFPHLASAYISGISVGILIRSPFLWPFALCAAISITSKYVLRWHNRHLWNPSNFGVSAMLFLYPAAVASLSIQWGNSVWPMLIVWCLGTIIIRRLKRLHICLTYVVSFIVLSGVRTLVTGDPFLANLAPLTGPMYQLFVFFMITDPRTTVTGAKPQCAVAFLVAMVEMLLRLAEVIHAPYFALFLVGPSAMVIQDTWKNRRNAVDATSLHRRDQQGSDVPTVSAADSGLRCSLTNIEPASE